MAEKTSKGRTAYDPPRFLPLADGVALGDARDAVQKIGLVTADSPETDFIRFFETQNGALYRRDIVRWSNDKLVDAGHYKGRKLLVWLDLSLKMHRFTSETEQVLLAEVTASSPFAFEKTATFLLLGYSPSEDWPEQLENLCISDPPSLFETARKTLDLPVPGAPVLDEFKPSPGEDLLDISRKVIGRQAYRMKANTPGAILAGDPGVRT
ncbi:MAG: hypothetical protein U5N86_13785 [Planctomycetota bacterium]|nr:hypothetical protein [Planctomycetota bacterium]